MRIERFGLSMFRIQTDEQLVLLTDPWISESPAVVPEFKDFENLRKIDVAIVTHGHLDHAAGVADLVAAKPDVAVVCPFELSFLFMAEGIKNVRPLNIGGNTTFGGVKIEMVSASHSSSYGPSGVPCGIASGAVITLESGYKIYYAGDTGLSSDMKFVIGDYYKPDLAIVPVSGNFTMDCEQAAYAVGEFIQAPRVIPCHYSPTAEKAPDPEALRKFYEHLPFGPPEQDLGDEFKALMQQRYPQIEVSVLDLGKGIEL